MALPKRRLRSQPFLLLAMVAASVACGGSRKGPAEACTPGQRQCFENQVRVCNAAGTNTELVFECENGEICQEDRCIPLTWGGDVTADRSDLTDRRDVAAEALPPPDQPATLPDHALLPDDGQSDQGRPDLADSAAPPDAVAGELGPELPDLRDGLPFEQDREDSPPPFDAGLEWTADEGSVADRITPDGVDEADGPSSDMSVADVWLKDTGPDIESDETQPSPDLGSDDFAMADMAADVPPEVAADGQSPGLCGNGVLEAGEQCEWTLPIVATCLPGQPGIVHCTADCQLDTSRCTTWHLLVYDRISPPLPTASYRGSFVDVAWAPDGASALILTDAGIVLGYDGAALSVVADLDPGRPQRIAWQHDGTGAWLAGSQSGNGAMWWYDAGSQTVSAVSALTTTGVPYTSVRMQRDRERAVVTGYASGSNVNRLYLLDGATRSIVRQAAYPEMRGLIDAMWGEGDPSELVFVITSDGVNGAASHIWYPDLDPPEAPSGNGWGNGFGNPGQAGWRPGGRFGILVGTSTNIIYVYQYVSGYSGSWTSTHLSDPGNMSAIGWHPAGTRALLAGRATGNPLKGTVYELRPYGPAFSQATTVTQFIPGFGSDPYLADSNTYVLALAWRPGPCDEGLLVGNDNGDPWSPGFGLAVHFVDPDDPDCE